MKIIAHRVTDALQAKEALDTGADFIEIDVAKRFLFPKFVMEHNSLKGKLGIGPLLASIFIPKVRSKLFLDLKHANLSRNFAKKLSLVLKTFKIKNVRVCGLDWKIISQVCHDNNLLPFYTILDSVHLKEIEKALPNLKKPAGFSVYFPLLAHDVVKQFKKHGEVWAWTVDDPKIAKDLVKLGVDGIITNNWREMMKEFHPSKILKDKI